jgi:hypothetical protein
MAHPQNLYMGFMRWRQTKMPWKKISISGEAQCQHNEHEAEKIIQYCAQAWGMQAEQAAMEALKSKRPTEPLYTRNASMS